MAACDMTMMVSLVGIVMAVVPRVAQAGPWETNWSNRQPTRSHYLFRALFACAFGADSVPRSRIAWLPRPTTGNGEGEFPRPCVSGYPPAHYQRAVLVSTRAVPVLPLIHQRFRQGSARRPPTPLMQNRNRGRLSSRLMSIERVLMALEEGRFERYTGYRFRSFPPPGPECSAIVSGHCVLLASFSPKCFLTMMKEHLVSRTRHWKSNHFGGMKGEEEIEGSRRQAQMHHPSESRHPPRGCQFPPRIDDRQW